MRILHIGKFYAPQRGGIERYTQTLAEWCATQGDAVAALVHQPPGRWRSEMERVGGIDVCRAGCIASPLYTPISPTFPLQLSRALRAFRPEVLHLHLPNPSCFALLASPAARRLPWIVHWHADVPPDSPDWRLRLAYRAYRPFEQALLRRAAAIVATSLPYLEASVALRPWRVKTRVVPLGAEPVHGSLATRDAWRGGGLRLLAVGRLSRYKGFDVLLRALARMEAASLVLAGDGECGAELRRLARELGIVDRVVFAGAPDDDALASLYAGADAFVLPSLDRGEAFGMVLLEAMRAGLPVVASAIAGSGVSSVVEHRASGLLVPPGDPDALARALDSLGDAALRRQLGDAGKLRWQDHFTLDRTAAQMRAIYVDVATANA